MQKNNQMRKYSGRYEPSYDGEPENLTYDCQHIRPVQGLTVFPFREMFADRKAHDEQNDQFGDDHRRKDLDAHRFL